ncbi:MAG TPA: DNA polymerase IV [Actinomycetota bacterium]|jgi:DNA polymerase-4|nr:DNA polymerase IV [Actinomycetota bacterium]
MVPEPILHVDMDAFYASVETIKDPSLKGRPVIVGGRGSRGVVTSASYEARAFGVSSAMPVVRARRLCPHGVFVPNDFSSYQDFSDRIREVFTSFTPLVEPLSLDEAFLDISGSVRLFGTSLQIAQQIKRAISELGLGCTVGVAPNKFLAKLASAWAKPDGLLVVPADDVLSFLHPLPVSALWGVGPQTGETLQRLGMKTVGDLAHLSRRTLERALGESLGAHLHALANGVDQRPVIVDEPSKSVGSEETYEHDLDSTGQVLRELLRLADRTAGRLRTKGLCGRTVTIKIRFSNFKTITRSRTLACEVDTAAEIYEVAKDLYERLHPDRPRIRLVGVSISALAAGPPRHQLDLLSDVAGGRAADVRRRDVAHAVDSIRSRFGDSSVAPATLMRGQE